MCRHVRRRLRTPRQFRLVAGAATDTPGRHTHTAATARVRDLRMERRYNYRDGTLLRRGPVPG